MPAFGFGGIGFFFDGGHVFAFAAIDYGRPRALSDNGAGAVDGGIAAAYDDNTLTQLERLLPRFRFEEMQRS